MRAILTLALFLAGLPCSAQVLVPSFGGSNLFGSQAEGAGLMLYLPSGSSIYAAAGWGPGHFQYGAQYDFKLGDDYFIHAGTQNFSVGFYGVGEGLALTGLSAERKTKKWDVILFAGLVQKSLNTPYMWAGNTTDNIGAGIFVSRKYKRLKIATIEALNHHEITAAQGVDFTLGRTLAVQASGGLVNSVFLFQASAAYHPVSWANVYAFHSDYVSPYRAENNSLGANIFVGRWTANLAVNEAMARGILTVGENLSGGVRIGPITETVSYFRSSGGGLERTLINSTTLEHISRHLDLSENFSKSNGSPSFSIGGGFHNNRFAVSVNRNTIFLLDGEGFANTTSVSLSLMKLPHDSSITFQTVTTPFGQTLYSASSTSYVPVGNGVAPGQSIAHSANGKFVVSGICRNEDDGSPQEGCAIEIGRDGAIAFSNSTGAFEVHVRKNQPLPLLCLPDVFAAPGNWKIVAAPSAITPGQPITITVRKAV
jgi:hypothetical protein